MGVPRAKPGREKVSSKSKSTATDRSAGKSEKQDTGEVLGGFAIDDDEMGGEWVRDVGRRAEEKQIPTELSAR